ncbi:class E sortase [Streptomyces sp. RerS4]|uniref:class E sortase n=1 Tax=Streptomyces sp. RerS4 TaxID=2942449 RepID=UPI00201C1556|nr:class E sortase [Streptomyces sp. RerS4]UQX01319.1 class E sortase [Streptomyces sp. RerS4]
MRAVRDRVRVVVQRGGREAGRVGLARLLWTGAELITTLGVVVALLVVHQVWWTNRQAAVAALGRVQALEREWAADAAADPGGGVDGAGGVGAVGSVGSVEEPGGGVAAGPSEPPSSEGSPTPGRAPAAAPKPAAPAREEAYAVLRVPRLGLSVPVAEGIDKRAVLDKGYAGHYPGTAQAGARGNFALAGHRNTHGEPFRYLNRLRQGDELIVDVRGRRYVYVVGKVLPETTARDTGVIAPVPRSAVKPEYGYAEPGSYITLTTCTPEYTSTYRLVVWGTLRS